MPGSIEFPAIGRTLRVFYDGMLWTVSSIARINI